MPRLCAGRAARRVRPDRARGRARTPATPRLAPCAEDGEWVINGSKQFITNAGTDISALVVITAVTGQEDGVKEISNLLVENGTPGYEPGEPYRKMGWNASDTRPLAFADCRVPEENLVGAARRRPAPVPPRPRHRPDRRRGDGRRAGPGRARPGARLRQERRAFGQPISRFQTIQAKLADLSHRDRGGPAARPQGGVAEGSGPQLHPDRRAGQAQERTAGRARRRRGGPDPRRLRLHRGVSGLPLLPRREDPHHRRGDRRGAADGDRQGARQREAGPQSRCSGVVARRPARSLLARCALAALGVARRRDAPAARPRAPGCEGPFDARRPGHRRHSGFAGEHARPARVTRTWTFFPTCPRGPCATVGLVRDAGRRQRPADPAPSGARRLLRRRALLSRRCAAGAGPTPKARRSRSRSPCASPRPSR